MADVVIRKSVQPYSLSGTFTFTEEELRLGFSVADPDEQLFFDVYGPTLDTLPASGKFDVLRRTAEMVERAHTLGLMAASPEPK